jgi:adenine-specific DNA-methyltransferase
MRQYNQATNIRYRGKTVATEQAWSHKSYELPLQELRRLAPDLEWKYLPVISPTCSPVEVCQIIGEWYRACSSDTRRHNAGQFFTAPPVARYMTRIVGKLENGMHVLDPGAGVGTLASAICEAALQQKLSTISITAYESDPALHLLCLWTLTYISDMLYKDGITISIEVHQRDFLEAMVERIQQTSLWSQETQPEHLFDIAILNPPYFKVNQKDPRAERVKEIAYGRTNMYTMFMSLAVSTLRTGGRFVSITPRSFASGAYFKQFRNQFFGAITPDLIHIFESRRSAFEESEVLQENIILIGTKKDVHSIESPMISISRCNGLDDLNRPLVQQVQRRFILDDAQSDPILHLPTSDIDIHLLQAFKRWTDNLATYGLEISTGPVVPFRSLDALTKVESVQEGAAVPLLWLQHVHCMKISWPLTDFDKPQAVFLSSGQNFLVKNATQIILRRFSAKEEPRRITAAVLQTGTFGTELIALENHLNYMYSPGKALAYEDAIGLASFLNSSLVDRYFRIISGNTQVSATELKKLSLPSWELIVRIGKQVVQAQEEQSTEVIEHIIMNVLRQDLIVGGEEDIQLPVLRDSRIVMGKIQDAQHILRELGLPPAQQNEISALTLLALCNLGEAAKWLETSQEVITIHNMMGFMKTNYGRTYAENTREVVRRQVIHQFEQARLIDRNPDDPTRPTNSPNTCYALTYEALQLFKQYSSHTWDNAIAHFLAQHGTLWEQYQKSRQAVALPLKLAEGGQLYLTPGKHNALQIAIIEKFGPRYARDAVVLYLGDAASKFVIYEQKRLEQLGVPITTHDKLPDVILYQEDKNWLYLIEAVTSHGPVSHKRKYELEKLLQHCTAQPMYVTAFPDAREFRRHAAEVAWETEVWIAETPEHMIHYNGDKFAGPHEK